jgi:hypothetical protein
MSLNQQQPDKLRYFFGNNLYYKFKKVFDACCGGISFKGDENKFLNQQGDFVEATASASIEDITYLELYNKVVNEELIPLQWYRLTDYKSVNFLNGWEIANENSNFNNNAPTDPNFIPREVYTGDTEVLLLQAITESEISPIGYSETYPQDIIQYNPLVNKIGVGLVINNGFTLPNSSVVSGFNLQWDGTNAYFEMPIGYPALFGHYFRIYFTLDSGNVVNDGVFEPLNSGTATCQFPESTVVTRIKVENGGTKILLLDITQQDVNDYDTNTLFVETVTAIENAYGWIERRQDTERNIDVPFDFRGRKYRRFEIDMSPIHPSFGLVYAGIGDDYKNLGTTGNYKDFPCFSETNPTFNIQWNDMGSPDVYYFRGLNDNNVFQNRFVVNNLKFATLNNTGIEQIDGNNIEIGFVSNIVFYMAANNIGDSFEDNIIGTYYFAENNVKSGFYNNVIAGDFYGNNIGVDFYDNTVNQYFISNTVGDSFANNIIGEYFTQNTIGNYFQDNEIDTNFTNNNIGNGFDNNNISDWFAYNKIGNSFYNNTIDEGFGYGASTSQGNVVGNYFYNNTIGEYFYNNTIVDGFYGNTIDDYFQLNNVKASVPNTDFTANPATYVYAVYNCEIFKASDTNLYLSYFDGTAVQYDNIDA